MISPKRAFGLVAIVIAVALAVLGGSTAHALLNPNTGPTAGGTSVTVTGIHFVKVSTGAAHSIGLTDQGTVYAWGVGSSGALGNGGTTSSSVPVPVLGIGGSGILSGVTDISAGYNHNLALTSDGVVAWGRNVEGQLGDGTFSTNSLTPVLVLKGSASSTTAYLQNIASVSAGQYFSSALTTAGTVVTWGQNANGQLGDGNTTNLSSPVQVQSLTGVSAIDCGYNHALAIVGGEVYGWGSNASGQLGNGTSTSSSTPVQVIKGQQGGSGSSLSGASAISAGGSHSFAITSSGLFGWGANASGQLGDGTTVASSAPVQVVKGGSSSSTAFFEGATQIDAGSSQSFALNTSGLFSWGTNASGEAGNVVGGIVPTSVVAVGGSGNMSGVIHFSSGWAHSAIVTDAGIASMGRGSAGRLGNGALVDQNVPVLGPNFAATGVAFGTQVASISSITGFLATVTSPPGSAGQVAVIATANVFGGTTAATPATVSWGAGTFTFVDPAPSPSPSASSSSSASPSVSSSHSPVGSQTAGENLAATGVGTIGLIGLGGLVSVVIGAAAFTFKKKIRR